MNFTQDGKLTHGVLHVYRRRPVHDRHWQPIGSSELYVLANAGDGSVRLIANPPRGEKADTGPGILPAQKVLSSSALKHVYLASTLPMASATICTLLSFRPATHTRPERRIYKPYSSFTRSACSATRPVYVNMPRCFT